MPKDDLTDFIEQVTGDSHLRVEDDLGDGFVRLRVSEAERRQARHDVRSTEDIVIEMLRNARDAHAKNIFVAVSRDGTTRRIVMLDDGDGVPEHMRSRIFEARVTSKLDSMHIDTWGVHGRGMALYAVRMNAQTAQVVASRVSGGSSFVVETNTTLLPEKVDQSSMPVFSETESGTITVRGTRNINRTVAEFAYLDRDQCTVYLGSPVEIAATLWDFGIAFLPAGQRAFCNDPDSVDVCKRLALASSPEDFVHLATRIGLVLSDRSARRIMDGDVAPCMPLVDSIKVVPAAGNPTQGAPKKHRSSTLSPAQKRSLKIDAKDMDSFVADVSAAFAHLAETYYLEPQSPISATVRKGEIHLRIPTQPLS